MLSKKHSRCSRRYYGVPGIYAKSGLFAGSLLFLLAGCGQPVKSTSPDSNGKTAISALDSSNKENLEPSDPKADALLRKSMDIYGGLKSFKTTYIWKLEAKPAQPTEPQTRYIDYIRPNLFKIVTATRAGTAVCVSDGDKILEYGDPKDPASLIPASTSVARAQSKLLGDPRYGGTMLLSFFSSSDYMSDIVDITKAPITLGKETTVQGGEKAQEIKFYGTGPYGHTTMLIGETTGKVYKISCDCEPLVLSNNQQNADKLESMTITEDYGSVAFNPSIEKSEFSVAPPSGMKVVKQEGITDKPPFPIGSPAPDITVTRLSDGKKITLSSLRGKVVMLDFWATYCQPCKFSMPSNELIYRTLHKKGLEVISISAEDKAKILEFDGRTKFTMGLYHDEDQKAFKAFKISPIPSMAIIDKEGKLANFFVGVTDASILVSKLRHLGVG